MNDTRELLSDLSDESDLCRNDGVPEIADLLDRAIAKINELAGRASMAKGPEVLPEVLPIDSPTRDCIIQFAIGCSAGKIVIYDDFWEELLSTLPKDDEVGDQQMKESSNE